MSVLANPKHVPTETVSCETTSQLSEPVCGFQSHSGSRRRHTTLSPDACILTRTSLHRTSLSKTHISAPRCPFWLIQNMHHIERCPTKLYLHFQSLSTCFFSLWLVSQQHYTVTISTRTSLGPPFLSSIATWYQCNKKHVLNHNYKNMSTIVSNLWITTK